MPDPSRTPDRRPEAQRRKAARPEADRAGEIDARQDRIDAILSDSFPASDPPSWTLGGSLLGSRRPPSS